MRIFHSELKQSDVTVTPYKLVFGELSRFAPVYHMKRLEHEALLRPKAKQVTAV